MCIYIYIYIERERGREIRICVHICIYIYIYTHAPAGFSPGFVLCGQPLVSLRPRHAGFKPAMLCDVKLQLSTQLVK